MPNAFSKSEMIFYEEVLEGYDHENVVARSVEKYSPNMTQMERSGLTVRRPQPMIAQVTSGRDVSSDYKDVSELTVPSSLAESDIKNHAFTLNALELNDATRRSRAAKAARQALSAKVDTDTSEKISRFGSLVATRTGDFTDYDDLSTGETMLMERGVKAERQLVLNPRMSRKMANDLAARQTDNARDRSAYERSVLPSVGGFETLKTGVITSLTGSSSSGVTVSGAGQRKTPVVFDSDLADVSTADNRYMDLTVSASSGLVAGDCFTIAGVNAIDMITKKDSGQLQTFRVIADKGSNVFQISPAIIPVDFSGDIFERYGNCTTTPADGAAITVLNTDTTQPSIFMAQGAVEIIHGKLGVDDLGPNVSIMRESTDSGIEIIFAKQGNIDDLTAKYRLTIWTASNVLAPDMCGIYLPGQNASFG